MSSHARPSAPSSSGLILAGGASSRFGAPKPLATFRGRPLVRWVGDALSSRCAELLVSVGVRDSGDPLRAILPQARLVWDRHSDRGPIEGLHRGCEVAQGDVVLVAPGDAPLLRPQLYDGLLRILGDHEAAVPRPSVMDPVRAVYCRAAALRALDESGDCIRSHSALVDRLDTVFLERDALLRADPSLASFIDVNRREDLGTALEAMAVVS